MDTNVTFTGAVTAADTITLGAGTSVDGNCTPSHPQCSGFPTVSAISLVAASPTNLASVSWTVTFSSAVTGVDTTDFQLLSSVGISSSTISSVSGSGTTWTVTADSGSGNGTLGLDLVDDDSINSSGSTLGGAGAGNGDYTGAVYAIDKLAPDDPVVNAQITTVTTPVITGTYPSGDAAGGFSVTVNGITYTLADTELSASGDGWTLDLSSITPLADGIYDVDAEVTDDAGNSSGDSSSGELEIASPPALVSSTGSCSDTTLVTVLFSEVVTQASAENTSNYSLDNGVTISGAALQADNQTVVLTTSGLADLTSYLLSISGISDPQNNINSGDSTSLLINCSGVVAYYRFDETSWSGVANEVEDLSGNGLHGRSVGGVTTSEAKVCNGAILDGITLAYVEVADNPLLDIADELTVSTWIKTNSIPTSGLKSILSKDENYEFHINSAGSIFWWWQTSGGTTRSFSTTNTVSIGAWHHITLVYSKSGGYQRIYIDGVQDSQTRSYADSLMQNSDPLQIGGDQFFATREFDGLIDEVRIYARALSSAEVLTDMNATHPCSNPLACSYRDSFTSSSFANDDGSLSWSSDWVESDTAATGPGSGYVSISSGHLRLQNSNPSESLARPGVARAFSLNGASDADIHYYYTLSGGVDAIDDLTVEISNDAGATWTTVDTINNIGNGSYSGNVLLSAFPALSMTANMQIALRINDQGSVGNSACCYDDSGETIAFNYVAIYPTGICSDSGPDHYEISHPGTGVTCEAAAVTISAHDASDALVVPSSSKTITLSTSQAIDSWQLKQGDGVFDGSNQYTFDGNESSVQFWMTMTTQANAINIDVTDGTATDPRDGGPEDLPIDFSNTAFRFYADGTADSIGKQISGKPNTSAPDIQSLTLRAVRTNSDTKACEAALTGVQAVNLAYECQNPSTCSGTNQLTVTADSTATINRNDQSAAISYSSVDMAFDINGEAPFSFVFNDSGDISLHAQKSVAASAPHPAFTLSGESNRFITRPFAFELDFSGQRAADWSDNNALDASTGNPSLATSSTDSIFITSGNDFDMSVRALLWEQTDSAADGSPIIGANLTDNGVAENFGQESAASTISYSYALNLPAGGDNGTLTATALTAGGGGGDFTAGTATTTMNWSEVGIIDVGVTLTDYLGTGDAIIGSAANLGRFIPASFQVVVSDPGAFANTHTLGGTPFTYLGESFSYLTSPVITITAVNSGDTTVTNYTGAFSHLEPSEISLSYPLNDTVNNDSNGNPFSIFATEGTHQLIDNGNGTFTFNVGAVSGDQFQYDRTAGMVTPFSPSLSISLSGVNETTDSVVFIGPETFIPMGNLQRYGRIAGRDAKVNSVDAGTTSGYLLDVQYYDGTVWENHADDLTTAIAHSAAAPAITCSDPDGSDGLDCSDISVTDATISNNSSFTLTLGTTIADEGGTLIFTMENSKVPSYLQFDWDGDGTTESGSDDSPSASITFAIPPPYHGNKSFIYWRESK